MVISCLRKCPTINYLLAIISQYALVPCHSLHSFNHSFIKTLRPSRWEHISFHISSWLQSVSREMITIEIRYCAYRRCRWKLILENEVLCLLKHSRTSSRLQMADVACAHGFGSPTKTDRFSTSACSVSTLTDENRFACRLPNIIRTHWSKKWMKYFLLITLANRQEKERKNSQPAPTTMPEQWESSSTRSLIIQRP